MVQEEVVLEAEVPVRALGGFGGVWVMGLESAPLFSGRMIGNQFRDARVRHLHILLLRDDISREVADTHSCTNGNPM